METIIVVLIVALAAIYLGCRSMRILRGTGKPGCASGCNGCGSAGEPKVVSLELGRGAGTLCNLTHPARGSSGR